MRRKNFTVPFLTAFMYLCLIPYSAAAQDLEAPERTLPGIAILQKGPAAKKGIDVLYPNAVPCFFGEYSYGDDIVRVYYTEEAVAAADSWREKRCSAIELHRLPERKGLVLFFHDEQGWEVFFLFPAGSSAADAAGNPDIDSGPDLPEEACRFVTTFLQRLRYFLGITGDEEVAPLPADIPFQ